MMKRSRLIVLVAVSLVAGVGLTLLVGSIWGVPGVDAPAQADSGGEQNASTGASKSDTYYTCPMHPSVVSDKPGACPVCHMKLIKKSKGGGGLDPQELAKMGKVALSPTQRVLANVATAPVERAQVDTEGGNDAQQASGAASEIRAVGIVTYDETGLATVPSWVDGRIESLMVDETGAVVSKGQPIMKIYSEELLTAQEEYLVAMNSSDPTLASATRKRLALLGMSPSQIDRLRKTHRAQETVTAFAPNAGTITDLKVRQGQYVDEGSPLYELADLSTVWVEAQVHEENMRAVHKGMKVRVSADAYPGESLQGRVTFVHPVLDSDTRTVKVRVELDNKDRKLKPGMYATVFFADQGGEPDESASPAGEQPVAELLVPKSAVIRGGKTNSVYVEVDDNVFERRQVELGRATDKYLVVKSGLEAGDEVAYRGGFLLDSEVQLNSFGGSGEGHGHGGGKAADKQKTSEKLAADDIPEDGKKFDPMSAEDAVPDGMWMCSMGGKVHWVQHEKGEGECPVCGMYLKQKGAKDKKAKAN